MERSSDGSQRRKINKQGKSGKRIRKKEINEKRQRWREVCMEPRERKEEKR